MNASRVSLSNDSEGAEKVPGIHLRWSRSAGSNFLRPSSSNESSDHSAPRAMSNRRSSRGHTSTASIIHTALEEPLFNFNGIPFDCFTYPSDLQELAPFEEHGRFKNKKHLKRYKALKDARKELLAEHKNEIRRRPEIMQKRRDMVAARFHSEFCLRVSWGDQSQPSNRSIGKQIPDSVFSSINTYLKQYPKLSIHWAVNDFYMQLNKAIQDIEAILDLKNQWEWRELHYVFFRTVSGVRAQFGMPGSIPRWHVFFSGSKRRVKKVLLRDLEIPRLAREEWSPEMDKKRRYQQFCTFQKNTGLFWDQGYPLSNTNLFRCSNNGRVF